jgi:hypothetical protein
MRRRLVLIGVAVAMTACGGLGSPSVPDPTPPTQVLAAWRDFPATRVPRPIVMFDRHPLYTGFTTGDAKIAAYCSKYELAAQLSTAAPAQATATWPDGTSVMYTTISAADAYAAIAKIPTQMQSQDCSSVAPLEVTGAHLGVSRFGTDRGATQMSAWLFTAIGSTGDIAYPAIAPTAFWTLPNTNANGNFAFGAGSTVSADGRTLAFGFVGGACDDGYKSAVAESPTAVSVAVVAIPKPGVMACPAIGVIRTIKVTLASPLDGRVVLDASGAVEPVCPETLQSC